MNKLNKVLSILLGFLILICIYILIFNSVISKDDGKEIERKWLINASEIPYELNEETKQVIVQTYINKSPELRLRNINNGEFYMFTVKANMSEDGLIRDEKEYYITEKEYNDLITKQEGSTINKTRYILPENGHILEFDIYTGDLEGLAYLEIEFENEEEAKNFETSSWVIKDVTDDIRYKNGSLAIYGMPK